MQSKRREESIVLNKNSVTFQKVDSAALAGFNKARAWNGRYFLWSGLLSNVSRLLQIENIKRHMYGKLTIKSIPEIHWVRRWFTNAFQLNITSDERIDYRINSFHDRRICQINLNREQQTRMTIKIKPNQSIQLNSLTVRFSPFLATHNRHKLHNVCWWLATHHRWLCRYMFPHQFA